MTGAVLIFIAFIAAVSGASPSVTDGQAGTPTAKPGNDANAIAKDVLSRLDAAWNAANSKAFAAEFTADADLINIFGMHFSGRSTIVTRMQLIFDTIFKGSVHRSRDLEMARMLSDDLVLAVSSAVVDVPSGPLAPRMTNRQTFLLVKEGATWRIRHWHNTLVRATP